MVFELLIKPIVFVDIDEAIEYYENQLAGLGKRFYSHLFSFTWRYSKSTSHLFLR